MVYQRAVSAADVTRQCIRGINLKHLEIHNGADQRSVSATVVWGQWKRIHHWLYEDDSPYVIEKYLTVHARDNLG